VAARRWTDWWRAPWWLLALATGAKSFADNPVLGSRRLNARGLHAARVRLAHALAARRRARLAGGVPPEWRAAFERDGFVVVHDLLSPEEFAALRQALGEARLPMRAHLQGDTVTARVLLGEPLLQHLPVLKRLLARPELKALFAYAAGTRTRPVHYLQTILGGILTGRPQDPQVHLHADAFFPSMKAWLFLADVPADGRPLTYVAGSHRLSPERLAWEAARSLSVLGDDDPLSRQGSLRIEERELAGLGLPPPTVFAVPANTLVVADMFGFHARGESYRPTTRVELWSYGRRPPFLPDLAGALLARLTGADLLYRAGDMLDRWGWRRQHWHDVGRQPIGAPDLRGRDPLSLM